MLRLERRFARIIHEEAGRGALAFAGDRTLEPLQWLLDLQQLLDDDVGLLGVDP